MKGRIKVIFFRLLSTFNFLFYKKKISLTYRLATWSLPNATTPIDLMVLGFTLSDRNDPDRLNSSNGRINSLIIFFYCKRGLIILPGSIVPVVLK